MIPTSTRLTREETLTDVPTANLDEITEQFEAAGATVTALSTGSGKWTVIATFETVTA